MKQAAQGGRYPVSIGAAPPPPAPDKDAKISAYNAKLADFIKKQRKRAAAGHVHFLRVAERQLHTKLYNEREVKLEGLPIGLSGREK